MAGESTGHREAALIAAARETLQGQPQEPQAKPDMATRMAQLVEAERLALDARRRRVRRNVLVGISAVMVPAFLYVFVNLFWLLVR